MFPLVFGSTNLSLIYLASQTLGPALPSPTPLQHADVMQWNLHLLQGFITSGPFYLYCFFNCLLSSPYSSLVNTYIYNIHPCSFTLLFFKLDTHTHILLLSDPLFNKKTFICYSLIYVILCIRLSLKSSMVVWSAPASSEEVAWKLNAKWTVATLLSQSLSDHGYVNRNYKQNQENVIVQLR